MWTYLHDKRILWRLTGHSRMRNHWLSPRSGPGSGRVTRSCCSGPGTQDGRPGWSSPSPPGPEWRHSAEENECSPGSPSVSTQCLLPTKKINTVPMTHYWPNKHCNVRCLNVQSRWPVTVTKMKVVQTSGMLPGGPCWDIYTGCTQQLYKCIKMIYQCHHTGHKSLSWVSWDLCFTHSSTKTSFVCSFVTTSPEIKPLPHVIKDNFDKDCRI